MTTKAGVPPVHICCASGVSEERIMYRTAAFALLYGGQLRFGVPDS